MRNSTLWVAILIGFPQQGLAGQQSWFGQDFAGIDPGARVRVSAPECGLFRVGGRFQGVVEGSLSLTTNETHLTCPLEAVEGLEVRRLDRRWGSGTAVGAALGAIGGAAIGGAISPEGIALGAVIGAPLGAAMGTGPRARGAALAGLGIGVIGGAAVGAMIGSGDDYWGPGFAAIVLGVIGAPVGAVAGSVVGLFRGEERWMALEPGTIRPQLAVTPDGRLGLGVSVTVRR